MNKVRITAIRHTVYSDLMAKYENRWSSESHQARLNGRVVTEEDEVNPIEHTCDVREGQVIE